MRQYVVEVEGLKRFLIHVEGRKVTIPRAAFEMILSATGKKYRLLEVDEV